MAELLDKKLARLKARLEDLKRNIPLEGIPLSILIQIEEIEKEIKYLTKSSYEDFSERFH